MDQSITLAVSDLHKRYRLLREPQTTLLQAALHTFRRRREDLPVLRGLNFQAHAGEALAIIGANGAGKSTLLKLLAGIIFPEEGRVEHYGRVSALLELGAGFQPELTGRDNLHLNATILGLTRPEIRAREQEIVAFAGLENFMDVPVKYYSTGMYMRLGFSVAVHVDAAVILIDEVFAVGDEVFQFRCLDKLMALRQAGTTLLLVSHDMNLVRRVADRVLWLRDGVIAAEGAPGKIIQLYTGGESGPAASGQRWGSREVTIDRVELRGPNGAPGTQFDPHQPLTVAIGYTAHQRIANPVFGFALTNRAGVLLYGDTTLNQGLAIPEIAGSGTLTLQLAALPYPPGSYALTVAVHDVSGAQPYDYHDKLYPFELVSPDFHRGSGITVVPHTWSLT